MQLTESAPIAPAPTPSRRGLAAVFIVTSFVGSALLFMVQPMVARFLLPAAGGSSALWNTAMVFFQITLLIGYLYAHASTRKLSLKIHPVVQIVLLLLPLAALPIALPMGTRLPTDGSQSLWVLGVLAVMVGLPFLALSTSSPTLQYWFAATDHRQAHDPYFLYAAGNIGSLGALVAYPIVVEPLLTLGAQAAMWTTGYVVFLAGSGVCAWFAYRGSESAPVRIGAPTPGPRARQRLRWLAWSFVPSALLLGVTRHISTDVASFPLLWIVPLVLYLLTFIIVFGRDSQRRDRFVSWAMWIGAAGLAATYYVPPYWLGLIMTVHLTWFFIAGLRLHGRLANDRPEPARLTEFFAIISVGGALGGVFTALVAPVVFDLVWEYPIAIAMALLLSIPAVTRSTMVSVDRRIGWALVGGLIGTGLILSGQYIALGGLAAIVALATLGTRAMITVALIVAMSFPLIATASTDALRVRSFFGVYAVKDRADLRIITSGTTLHGSQDPNQPHLPRGYYHPAGPIGQVFERLDNDKTVGVVGLGAGGLTPYAAPGEDWVFYEIDPLVVELATSDLFSYLEDAEANVRVEVVDGRVGVAEAEETYDLLIIDAFTSDAIPVHLMTQEAISLYLNRLAPDGILMLHVSNRHMDLEGVIGRSAAELGVKAVIQNYSPTEAEAEDTAETSIWIGMANSPDTVDRVLPVEQWDPLPSDGPVWTDDYSNILSVLDL